MTGALLGAMMVAQGARPRQGWRLGATAFDGFALDRPVPLGLRSAIKIRAKKAPARSWNNNFYLSTAKKKQLCLCREMFHVDLILLMWILLPRRRCPESRLAGASLCTVFMLPYGSFDFDRTRCSFSPDGATLCAADARAGARALCAG